MQAPDSLLFRAARALTFASAATVLFSIAASQILMALALAALLISGAPLRLPPVWKPLALFLAGTLVALAFSADPAGGLPQVRKMFVFTMLLLVASTLRNVAWLRRLFLLWAGIGALVAVRALVQFGAKRDEAQALGRPFYEYYVSERITGFMSHWMTFGGQEMFAFLMLGSFVFFAPGARKHLPVWLACGGLIGAALVLGFTRGIWLALFGAGLYLLWCRKRILIAAVPVLAAAGWFVAPESVRTRSSSVVRPSQQVDSNQHRIICWRTGWEMIRAHPFTGLGPEEVKRRFLEFVPDDIQRPLPEGWYGHLHNIYLHYAAERGVAVLAALLWLLGMALWHFRRGLRQLPPGAGDARFLLHGATAVLLATAIGGITEHNLGDSEVLTMFLVVLGSGYIALEERGSAAAAA